MAQHSIVKLAKQGDPRAIAYLITHTLKKHGIKARASLQGRCLKLLLEAEQVPHQRTMTKLIVPGMEKLNLTKIQTLKLYGRKLGQPKPAWRQVIELTPQSIAANRQANLEQADLEPASGFFQMDDLDPEALILLPVEPSLQLDDLDPEALILFPLESETSDTSTSDRSDGHQSHTVASLPPQAQLPDDAAPPQLTPISTKLPTWLTRLLWICLWLQVAIDTLRFGYSFLNAGSFSLYTGLDLDNTNQTFAGLLSIVVGIAGFVFAPLDSLKLWVTLVTVVLFLFWLYRLHRPINQLFAPYPISPKGVMLRFLVPVYNLWGIGSTFFTLAKRLAQADLQPLSRLIRRLTVWLYLLVFLLIGLQGFALWLVMTMPTLVLLPWFMVARDGVVWLISLVWLRLVRLIWRGVRTVYRDRMAPLPVLRPRPARVINLRAILLGSGASLLSLILFNCLLALVAGAVFISNDLPPESIIPTFYDSEGLLILVLIGSFFCVGLGGFLTASVAIVARLMHAFALGVFLTLIGVLIQRSTLLLAATELPFWFQTASTVSIIPAAVVGGGLYQWLKTL